MTISPELSYAILALDSYNRGYDEGVPELGGLGSMVGSYEFVAQSDTAPSSPEVAASFYAAANQDASGNIVISYRGTDAPLDVVTGWTGGAGFRTRQAELAAQFYHQVKQAYPDATITLTGHSLGPMRDVDVAVTTNTSPRRFCKGQRLTAGGALQRRVCAVYGAIPPTEVLGAGVAKAPARGGGRALPGGLRP